MILGYLVVGMAIGPHALGLVGDLELIETAATVGVALLMFTLGLEVSVAQLRQVGKVGLWGGIAQILVTFALGVIVGTACSSGLYPKLPCLGWLSHSAAPWFASKY